MAATETLDDDERKQIWDEFHEAVNMTPAALEKWLETEDSRSVGWTHEGESEAVGHQEGRRIVAIKHRKKAELSDDDIGTCARSSAMSGRRYAAPAAAGADFVTRTGIDFAAGVLACSSWCQSGMSGFSSG